MQRILDYALDFGYTKYTSTLKEAWRLSISGLSESIIKAAEIHESVPEMGAEDSLKDNEIASFGVAEAIKHRERGISLQMFLGLFKYYRQSYIDLLELKLTDETEKNSSMYFINRVFDIIETGLCVEWAGGSDDQRITDLQIKNREMTNEKNKYLTIFESIPNPAFLLSAEGQIENLNHAAAKSLESSPVSGNAYYTEASILSNGDVSSRHINEALPWLKDEIDRFYQNALSEAVFEKEVTFGEIKTIYWVKLSPMLDVSEKFTGVVLILEDITTLKEALHEVNTLTGLIPICSHCKKMRDDKGYWSRLEEYIEKRSEALFSHSVCEECLEKHYDF